MATNLFRESQDEAGYIHLQCRVSTLPKPPVLTEHEGCDLTQIWQLDETVTSGEGESLRVTNVQVL